MVFVFLAHIGDVIGIPHQFVGFFQFELGVFEDVVDGLPAKMVEVTGYVVSGPVFSIKLCVS